MKLTPLFYCTFFFLATITTGFAEPDRPKTPLAEQMSAMSKGLRQLRREMSDPAQKEAALQHLAAIEENAAKAKTFEPAKTEKIPAEEREKFVADYKEQIDELIERLHKLEAAIRDGNTADANAVLDGLQPLKRKNHERFNLEKE